LFLASILRAEDSIELLQNTSFEEASDSIHPDLWSSAGGTLSVTDLHVRSGNFAASFTSETINTKWIHQLVNIQGGNTYCFSGYAWKGEPNIETVYLEISFYDNPEGDGSPVLKCSSTEALMSDIDAYRFLTTGDRIAPPNAHSARVKAMVVPHSATPATAYFDDLSFIGPAPTPSPTPTVTPAPTPNPTPTLEPTPTPTPTPTLTPTPAPSPTPTPTLLPTSTPIPTQAPTATPIPTPTNEGDIIINEIQYDPPQTGVDASFEWLELLNCTSQTIDLTNWKISDNHDADTISSLTIPPGGFAVVAASADFYSNFPDFSGNIVFIADTSIGNGLSNTGDRLTLLDPTGKIIDALSYGDDDTIMLPPCQDVPEGHSLERQPAGLDTNQASDFVDNTTPSPGYGLPSATEMPTPSSSPSPSPTPTSTPTPPSTSTPIPTSTPTPPPTIMPSPTFTAVPTATLSPAPSPVPALTPNPTPANEGDIVINEVQYDPPQTGVESAFEWVELFNHTSRTVDLTDWKISDNHETDSISSLTLPPGGFAVAAARTDFYTNFPSFSGTIIFMTDGSIGNGLSNTGDRIILLDPTGKIIDALSYGDDNAIMSPPCRDVPEGHSLERQPAGLDTNQAGNFVDNATPSPGYSLPSATPTPTPTPTPSLTPTPTIIPTSPPTTAATPTPNLTPKLTPAPSLTTSPSASQAQSWIHTRIPAFLFLIGITLFAAVFLLRRQN
jgi:hypothetical protein